MHNWEAVGACLSFCRQRSLCRPGVYIPYCRPRLELVEASYLGYPSREIRPFKVSSSVVQQSAIRLSSATAGPFENLGPEIPTMVDNNDQPSRDARQSGRREYDTFGLSQNAGLKYATLWRERPQQWRQDLWSNPTRLRRTPPPILKGNFKLFRESGKDPLTPQDASTAVPALLLKTLVCTPILSSLWCSVPLLRLQVS